MRGRYEVTVWQDMPGYTKRGVQKRAWSIVARRVLCDTFDEARARARTEHDRDGKRLLVSVFDVGTGAVVLRLDPEEG